MLTVACDVLGLSLGATRVSVDRAWGRVGMGHERRTITSQQSQVTALYLDDVPVHVNLVSRE